MIATAAFLKDQHPGGPRTIGDYSLAGLIGHEWKGGDAVLGGGLFGIKRRCTMNFFLTVLTNCVPVRVDHLEWTHEFRRMQHGRTSW
jgi:hypothetical protein